MRPPVPCGDFVSGLLAMKLTLLVYHTRIAVVGVDTAVVLGVAVVVGGVAVGAGEGKGHRERLERRSV